MEQLKKPSNCLSDWFGSIVALNQSSLPVKQSLLVSGRVDIALGARSHKAKVDLEIIDNDEGPTWSHNSDFTEEMIQLSEWAVFGFLDVALTSGFSPVSKLQINVKSLDVHPVDSSPMAFRLAGRNAGNDFICLLDTVD